jgi:hypothetical protein
MFRCSRKLRKRDNRVKEDTVMQLIAADILRTIVGEQHDGLTPMTCGVGLVLGLLLWLFGWWGHRFWIVLFTTVLAGIAGLSSGHAAGVKPIVAGLLLAVSAGMMALALARLVAFVAGGVAFCLALHILAPSWSPGGANEAVAWESWLLCFLGGGLAGLMLFRLWMMALTSLVGTLLIGYSGLCLLDRLGKIDALVWAEQRTALLNWSCVGVCLLGLLTQYLVDRWRKKQERQRLEADQFERAELELEQRYRRKSWWRWGQEPPRRAA